MPTAKPRRSAEFTVMVRPFTTTGLEVDGPRFEAFQTDSIAAPSAGGLIVVSPGQIVPQLQRLLDRGFPLVVADRPLPLLERLTVAALRYEEPASTLVHRFKFGGDLASGALLEAAEISLPLTFSQISHGGPGV